MSENAKSGVFFRKSDFRVYVPRPQRKKNIKKPWTFVKNSEPSFVYSVVNIKAISRDFEGKTSDPHLQKHAAGPTGRKLSRKLVQDTTKGLSLHQDR